MSYSARRSQVTRYLLIVAVISSFIALPAWSSGQAQPSRQSASQNTPGFIRLARTLESDRTALAAPVGVAFAQRANEYIAVEAPRQGRGQGNRQGGHSGLDLVYLTSLGDRDLAVHLDAAPLDAINLAYDNHFRRLLMFERPAGRLIEVREGADGRLDPTTLAYYDAASWGVSNPQGIAVDQSNGRLLLLDGAGTPRIVVVTPASDGSFSQPTITQFTLATTGQAFRGLALDPSSGNVQTVSRSQQALIEFDPTGQLVDTRDLTQYGLRNPNGIMFAPSGDMTDDPAEQSLYVADSGTSGQGQAPNQATAGSTGQVKEFSLAAPPNAGMINFASSTVRTTNMAALSPPSPDPSGITYLSNRNTLLISDGEVEETVSGITHFQGVNVWEMTLGGSIVRTTNISKVAPRVVPVTNEPTGTAWNPGNGDCYVTDDDAARVYTLHPGPDGLCGTADDSFTFFDTLAAGNGDAEGVTFDTWHDRLFVSDGVNAEVYQYTLDGTLVGHFDVEQYGVIDNETVEFNPDSGTLFVCANGPNPLIIETTVDGQLLRTISTTIPGSLAAAGMAYAPASDGSSTKRFYIVDRGIDNNDDPNIVDGKIFEITAPAPVTPSNAPPVVNAGPDQSINLPNSAALNGSATDDGSPTPPGTLTYSWQQGGGPGVAVFANATSATTTVSFPRTGTYTLCLNAFDGELMSTDCLDVAVGLGPGMGSVDSRVSASSDDAEEAATGGMTLGSTHLEMVLYNGANQAVGMRFNGITIPQGAQILQASVQFQADRVDTDAASLTFAGQARDNALTFAGTGRNITNRPRTTTTAVWSPAPWTQVGAAGLDQQTPELKTVIQEIVNRPGWASGNSLAVIVTGSGVRVAVPYDGRPATAPLLHVEYSTPSQTPTPTATAISTSTPIPTDTATPTPTGTSTSTNTPTATSTNTPTSTSTPIISPTTTATTSDAIFADGFETGNFSRWTAGTGTLVVTGTAALTGTWGLQTVINNTSPSYVTDDTPGAEPRYRARFYLNPNSITIGSGKSYVIFAGYNAAGTSVLQIVLGMSSSGTSYQVGAGLLTNSGSFTNTTRFAITNATHYVEVDWRASTGPGANNGGLTLWIDGVQRVDLTGVDNDTLRVDSVRLGAVSGIGTTISGSHYLDGFESRRQTYIGP
jgi:hypothetical protein